MNTLSYTKSIINKYNIKASKKYGQNFLISDEVLGNIVKAGEISKEDLVIEIGPGIGNLTEYILDKAGFGILIEIDERMNEVLADRLQKFNNYELINEDVLKLNLDDIIQNVITKYNIKIENVKVVANLPYYITSPIIFKLLEQCENVKEIVVMIQKEVADRIVATPKTKSYGILSIMLNCLADVKFEFEVQNNCFIPMPDVTSAVIKITKNNKYEIKDKSILKELVNKAFAQRRKKMINSLVNNKFMNMNKEQIEELLINSNISLGVRAEELSVEEYIKLANNFNK